MHDIEQTPALDAQTPLEDAAQSSPTPKTRIPFGQLFPRMVKVAFTPQKLVLLVIFLAAAAVCARLGVWQLDRAYERANLAQEHAQSEAESQAPDELGAALRPQETFGGSLVGKLVSVTGTFDSGKQLLVAGRHVEGDEGFLVLDALTVTDDGSGGASWASLSGAPILPVVRGWVPLDAVDADGVLTDEWAARVRTSPTSTSLVGWLQAGESALTQALPVGQTNSISSAALANAWGGPMYSGYLVVQSSDPVQGSEITALDRPSIEGSEGLNVQNLFYALQWWVFGAFAVALWLRLIADEAKRDHTDTPANPFDLLDAQ